MLLNIVWQTVWKIWNLLNWSEWTFYCPEVVSLFSIVFVSNGIVLTLLDVSEFRKVPGFSCIRVDPFR